MRVFLATNSRDRGSTSRTLEAWIRLLPSYGVTPIVSIGGTGPLDDALRASGVDVHIHPIRQFFRRGERWPFLREVWRLAVRLRRSRVCLVHVNEHEHYRLVAHASNLARVPLVTHVRFRVEPPFAQWLFRAPYTPRRVFFTSRTQMRDTADAIATAVPRDRFRLIYNGLDFDRFGVAAGERDRLRAAWGMTPETIAIGTASSISPRKRLDHFIRLVAALHRQGLPVRGFIAGQPYFDEDEVELRALRALRRDLDLEDIVAFLGYVEPAEPLFHAWDLTISTSTYETFGMTMLEAMACGCPVVAYPGGSIAEVVADAGPIVPDGDETALAHATAALCHDTDARQAAARRAQERARFFDIHRSVEQLAQEYRHVTNVL
jgi:glycosyltransferase involved in cell wall biosynthesis